VQAISVRSLASLQYSLQYLSFPETVQLQAGCAHFLFFSSAIKFPSFLNEVEQLELSKN
jgi:hypothetical protein